MLRGEWEGWLWPSYHPALGMRDTPRMTQLLEDFRHLGQWVRGEWKPPEPTARPHHYELLHGELNGMTEGRPINVDTESDGDKPWSVQWSATPRRGCMLLAHDERGLAKWEAWRREYDPEIVLHNAPQDMDRLERMGIHVTKWRDTQQEAFQLCSLSQGLKPLAYRLLGVTMRSWEDVVWPASVAAVSGWMEDAIGLAQASLEDVQSEEQKTYKCLACGHRAHSSYKVRGVTINMGKVCRKKSSTGKECGCEDWTRTTNVKQTKKPSAAAQILRHVLNHTAMTQDDDKPYDPWEALGRMKVEGLRGKKAEKWEWDYLEGELGTTPILSIAHAEMSDAIMYAVGDADMTGQVAAELERLRGGAEWEVPREDWDR